MMSLSEKPKAHKETDKKTTYGDEINVSLRKINEKDLEMIMNWRMSPEVSKYMYTDPELTLEEQKKWLVKINADLTCKYWIINVNNFDIGVLGLTDIDFANKRCSWIWYIGEVNYRGIGIAQLVQCNVHDYIFYELGLNRLYSEVIASNLRNIKAYEKLGYLVEGILKEHIYKNGEFYDVAMCGITKDRWDTIKCNYNYKKITFEE